MPHFNLTDSKIKQSARVKKTVGALTGDPKHGCEGMGEASFKERAIAKTTPIAPHRKTPPIRG